VSRRPCEEKVEGLAVVYRRDFPTAARRHLRAAQTLYENEAAGAQPGCRAVAAYLFGLAGELAVKQMMRVSGMRELPSDQRRDDPSETIFTNFLPSNSTMKIVASKS
jgi:hypothetical protein